jgi:hypothetical protein
VTDIIKMVAYQAESDLVTLLPAIRTLTLLPSLLAIRPSRRKTERTTLAFQPSFATRNFRSTSNGIGPDPLCQFPKTGLELRRNTGLTLTQLNEVTDDIRLTLLAALSLKASNPFNFTPCESR